ncbi:hypothetical protein [Microbacterium sp. NIBRBAC000506063]|uniref:hypothetical protein n=1 Tax=Microbacterium sp. NIBRBAC000506063 TaxID=2734618 RepID=UPI001BB635DF|nr:hypothetical protein [Microbacterium sp. NIBRBAC000506063]QTV80193.1 hypothetical protein KAE78_03900 [Microbacterium sp. NIBRBAC000506063]
MLRLGTNSGIVRFVSEQRAFDRAGSEWRILMYAALPVVILSAIASVIVVALAEPLAIWLASPGEEEGLQALLLTMAPFIVAGSVIGVLQIMTRMVRGVPAFTLLQSVLLPASRLLLVVAAAVMAGNAWAAFSAWLWPLPCGC